MSTDEQTHPGKFDVVVVGGGAAGVAAAVGAAQAGARVGLVERHGYLGGTAVAGSVLTYCGFFDHSHTQVVAGVGQRFLDRLDELDLYLTHTSAESGNKVVLLDLETTKRVFDSLVLDAGVTPLLHATVFGATTVDGRVTALDVAHHGGTLRLEADAFVDGSGDGVLLDAVGAARTVLPAARRQASTLVMRIGGVREDGDLSRAGMTSAVAGYRGATGVELPRDHGVTVRLPVSREIMVLVADQHRDVLDAAESTSAEIEGRRLAMHYFQALRTMRGWESSFLAATGPELGVRETRRLAGLIAVTADDVTSARRRPDGIARGGWPMEDHAVPGVVSYGGIRDDSWYDIPYGSLTAASLRNLWAAGRLVSSDGRAYGSVRVMGTAFATGHAAGVAAALSVRSGPVAVGAVQDELRRQGALL
ncbi:FAD-dependent oxidoreductase [Amycolatopsis sp. NPDC001319]|uniref:FAD-dependent oxidoreductase n=1 Tax=unclassified Amycolatopsis TaxID=2618356 RepID=UPI0036B7A464